MFFSLSAVLALFFSLLLVGQVAASPLPLPVVAAIEGSVKRQTPPVQEASKSDGGAVVPYKRQTPPVQDASKSDGGAVVPYKRQAPPVQEASRSDGSIVVPYKRQAPPVEEATKSDGGAVVPYKRHSEIPLELAVRSVNGVVELY